MKLKKFKCFTCILMFSATLIYAQESNDLINDTINKFSIENCVNKFDINESVKTKVGYQYWFADKEFLDGRTLKMSVVAPHKATHAPHKHVEDEFLY